MNICRSIACTNPTHKNSDFCQQCLEEHNRALRPLYDQESMSAKYPKYYKSVGNLSEIDVYAVHKLFNIQDPSGAIQHASKKLLLSGVRTGGKSAYKDITEARDTLNRWLQLNDDTQ